MAKYNVNEIKGVIPALVTTFDMDENFDEKRMRALVDHLIGKGVDGLYLTGSTGEGFLMTPQERMKVVEVVVDQVNGRIPLIAHVGAIGTKISIDLAKQAASAGVDAISSVPPFYWKFGADDVFNYYKDITGSTDLPMIVYNIALAGLVGFEQVKRFSTIEGVAGVKYTATSHFEVMRMKEEIGNDFLVYSGCDEMAMSGLSFGADGLIGSFYNLMPELFIAINKAMAERDLKTAEEKQRIANIIIMHATQKNYVAIMKRALSWMGVDGGYCRRPFSNFGASEEAVLKDEFRLLRDKHDIKGVDFLDAL
ncbi:dihydrodipicolinate synthase family protein [Spirochaeta isovalerica]|uniref:N-acetylneuraminate lyase n=1 Tax=Spirochaeta isovalerica TaxID=150 RepID=A0A841RBC0_9SPIO|nr:dihydrodipicolinate synthase family protein [Spirochaeta isovalerica]MBB6479978.1 N-acetylneuraminate lyase [Spirochaeta isovalerica]